MTREGHLRSGRFIGAKGRYLWIGIDDIGNSLRGPPPLRRAAVTTGRSSGRRAQSLRPALSRRRKRQTPKSRRVLETETMKTTICANAPHARGEDERTRAG